MLTTLTSPTLLISRRRYRVNLDRMLGRARRHGVELRPHFKTHQSATVSTDMLERGLRETTVTSLRMARQARAFGWPATTIAMPLNPRELPELRDFRATGEVSVFLADEEVAATFARQIGAECRYFIELDAGYGRTGVPAGEISRLRSIIGAAGPERFRGFYVHSGHTYDVRGRTAITRIHRHLLGVVATLRSKFSDFPDLEFSVGDTPACSTQEEFRGLTSIGPGNFIYYDLVQETIGSNRREDIAVCAALPVLQVAPERGEVVVHGGWTQLGKDRHADGHHGLAVRLEEDGSWDGSRVLGKVTKLSQEHGTIVLEAAASGTIRAGEIIGVLPVHACAVVHNMRYVHREVFVD